MKRIKQIFICEKSAKKYNNWRYRQDVSTRIIYLPTELREPIWRKLYM